MNDKSHEQLAILKMTPSQQVINLNVTTMNKVFDRIKSAVL